MNDTTLPAKPRICLVIASLRAGGAERMMANLANEWAARKYQVELVSLDGELTSDHYDLRQEIVRTHIRVTPGYNLLSRVTCVIRRWWELRQHLRFKKPDVVLSFLTSTNVLMLLATIGIPCRRVISERTDPRFHYLTCYMRLARRTAYRLCDLLVVQTCEIGRFYAGYKLQSRIAVIPNYLPIEFSIVQEKRTPLVLFIGRLDPFKGADILLKAFAGLRPDSPEWSLEIIGDGPQREVLEKLARDLGIASKVKFIGIVKDLRTFYSRASLFVLPSLYEGFPNVLLEAMANGLAVIASQRAGHMLIENEINGLLVPSGDIHALTKSMGTLIEKPHLRWVLGAAARRVCVSYGAGTVMPLWDHAVFGEALRERRG